MTLLDRILDDLTSLEDMLSGHGFADAATTFHQAWREAGRRAFETWMQARIDAVEADLHGARQVRGRTYHTPVGTIRLTRRAYDAPTGSWVPADEALGLPRDAWLPEVLELACTLGAMSEFPNANRIFARWSGIQVDERTLANQVEAAGAALQTAEFAKPLPDTAGPDSALAKVVQFPRAKPVVYVGLDGIMTPANAGMGYKEALVGVVYREADHRELSPKRAEIRRKEYIATLLHRKAFGHRLAQVHGEVVGTEAHDVVVLADGAAWIWALARELFPQRTEILDFFHVGEYVWGAARACLSEAERAPWAELQLERLKRSEWQLVREAAAELPRSTPEAKDAVRALRRYLKNNQSRIDYAAYLARGLAIGSGVVESANRRVVAQRCKQAGMHWSLAGADAVMALRAAYLSTSARWRDHWEARTPQAA